MCNLSLFERSALKLWGILAFFALLASLFLPNEVMCSVSGFPCQYTATFYAQLQNLVGKLEVGYAILRNHKIATGSVCVVLAKLWSIFWMSLSLHMPIGFCVGHSCYLPAVPNHVSSV